MREMIKNIRKKAADVWRKVILPALLATFYMLSTTGTVAFAAGGDTSAVTKPLENLKTLIIAVIGAIGINIHTGGTPDYEDTQWDFYSGNCFDLILLDHLPQITECPQAMVALRELMAAYPTAEVIGSLPEGIKQGQAGQEKGKDFQYGADAYEADLKESDPVEKNGREAAGKKQRDRAESHGR